VKVNRIIAKAIRRIDNIEGKGNRRRFRKALEYAVLGNGNTPPKIYCPEEISVNTGISVESQYENWIVLDFERSVDFLKSLKCRVKPQAFRKKLSASNYQNLLCKDAPGKVGNRFVFTHLEILRIADEMSTLELPEEMDMGFHANN